MAAANILTIGNTAADSGPVTVTAGSPLTVCLKGDSVPVEVAIKLNDDVGGSRLVGYLTSDRPVRVISGPGVYIFSRKVGQNCGVFSG